MFSIVLLIIVGLVILSWPDQTYLDRLKDAATFGGFALLLASFALTARCDHAMGDFEFLLESLDDLLEIRQTLTPLCQRYNPNGDTDRQIKISKKLIVTYQTALTDLKSNFRLPLPLPRSSY